MFLGTLMARGRKSPPLLLLSEQRYQSETGENHVSLALQSKDWSQPPIAARVWENSSRWSKISLQWGAPGESYSKRLPFSHQYLLFGLSLAQMGLREGQGPGWDLRGCPPPHPLGTQEKLGTSRAAVKNRRAEDTSASQGREVEGKGEEPKKEV